MKRLAAFAVLLIVLAAPAWAGFDEGYAAYDRGDYATALREFRALADQGDAVAQFNLGDMYAKGQGVPQDTGLEEGLAAYKRGDYATARAGA